MKNKEFLNINIDELIEKHWDEIIKYLNDIQSEPPDDNYTFDGYLSDLVEYFKKLYKNI